MKLRALIALMVVMTLFFGGSIVASASDDQPNCWWVGYTVKVMGAKVVKIPNRCVPCLAVCDAYSAPPAKSS